MSYIQQINTAIYSALLRDLPDIEENIYGYNLDNKYGPNGRTRSRRPYEHEIGIFCFPETWGSTSLGFGGIGGQAITTAMTTIVIDGQSAVVYFGGRLAYKVDKINKAFYEDMRNHNMVEVGKHGKYTD